MAAQDLGFIGARGLSPVEGQVGKRVQDGGVARDLFGMAGRGDVAFGVGMGEQGRGHDVSSDIHLADQGQVVLGADAVSFDHAVNQRAALALALGSAARTTAVLDTMILTLAIGLLSWVFLVEPTLAAAAPTVRPRWTAGRARKRSIQAATLVKPESRTRSCAS